MGKVVGIKFSPTGKVYDFDAGHFVLEIGAKVIVETEHGKVLGEVCREPKVVADEDRDPEAPPLKSVYRMATDEDLAQVEDNRELESEAFGACCERAEARGLAMNLVKVESLFDRSKIIFYFTADGRLDFRELVRDLVARFRTRVEMRQIGVRHEAKLLGGIGSCGRELCCCTFLRDFEPVSVKMAKTQNLSLNPTKISGLCGRLMCCLTYEHETYKCLKKGMPKLGKRIKLHGLEGKVIRMSLLERKVTVALGEGREVTGSPEELAELGKEMEKEQEAEAKQAAEAKQRPRGRSGPPKGRPGRNRSRRK